MPSNILMPALSPTMEKGNLTKWLKQEGDQIRAGDAIAEIETDKATMEVEAVDEGTLAKIVVPAGTADVPVNELIGIIAAEGEDVATASKAVAPAKADAAPAPKVDAQPATPAEPRPEAKPAASNPAPAPKANGHDSGPRIFASPLARRIASQKGVDLGHIKGSGPHGRIIERDVKDAKPGAQPAAAAAPAPRVTPTQSDAQTRKLFAEGSFEEIPHDSMRKTIARRLVEAKATIPHFYLNAECNIDAMLAMREAMNASAPQSDGKPAWKLSVNDFIIKALAMALVRVPDANVAWTETAMLRHKDADIGVAVSIPGGLITPIIRKAQTKSLSAISAEMKDLAGRARNRKLKPQEYEGGSSAVSNLGMFGTESFSAVINPPQATILAVGAGIEKPVVMDGKIVPATLMRVTLSCDHRAVDGALGAQLLQAFKALIETPVTMLI